MFPLPAHTVDLVLQYISPLTDPLPPHLISTPLRQRHHFLQISPSSLVDYLCWPSPDNAKVINLLDQLPPRFDHPNYPTRYTSDPGSTFAHVHISGLRLVFYWDSDTWKYHDLCLMPCPSPSFSTPQGSLPTNSEITEDRSPHPVAEVDQINSDSDDSYWASYGSGADDMISPSPSRNTTDTVGEDTYWAQYASVQGSADSTVPSPLPVSRKLRPAINSNDTESVPFPPRNEPIIDVPVDAIHSRPRLGPPPPNTLVHLLNAVSPRKDVYYSTPDDPYPSQTYSTDPFPEQNTADSELLTPLPDVYLDAAVISPAVIKVNGVPPSKCRPRLLEAEDKALKESIKGLYYLWKSGRKGEPDVNDRDVFLQIVQEAVTYD